MNCRVRDVMEWIDESAPSELAESWDRIGLQIGDPKALVRHVRVALTLTEEVASKAEADGVDMVVAHHPVLFKPASELRWDRPEGRLLPRLLKAGISVHIAHTNFDAAPFGTSHLLAAKLSLLDSVPLQPQEGSSGGAGLGMGRIGRLERPLAPDDFVAHVCAALGIRALRTCGPEPGKVEKVAVMGGSGASFLRRAAELGADAFVTGDMDFHDALVAGDLALWTLDAGHFSTERWIVPYWVDWLQGKAQALGMPMKVTAATERDPFDLIHRDSCSGGGFSHDPKV